MRRICVFQLARFGDVIQSKRLLLSLAAEKGAEVHLCVDESLCALARLLYPFCTVHSLPAHKAASHPAAVFTLARATFAELAALAFNEVYLLNVSPLSFACAGLFAPTSLRGYARVRGQDMRGRLACLAFNFMRDRRFAPLNLMDLWAHFHPSPVPPEQVNPVPRAAGGNRIGIVMAGRESRRSLPPPVLAACVQAIFRGRNGPGLVCIGSKNERPLVRRLLRELPARTAQQVEDCTGRTALTDLPELMRGLDMLLTPDTGAMHLAAHLGVPVQAFFLSSAWCYETGPYGFGHKVWQALEPCSPCRETAPCPRSKACLSPFSHQAFLAHLAGTFDASWPDGLLGCVSMLDDVGVTYKAVDGDDPYATARRELRGGLADYFGRSDPERPAPSMCQEIAEFLYTEKDWMLPGNWPHA